MKTLIVRLSKIKGDDHVQVDHLNVPDEWRALHRYPDYKTYPQDFDKALEIGQELFGLLFEPDGARDRYNSVFRNLTSSAPEMGVLVIEISKECSRWCNLPWELLSKPTRDRFLIDEGILVVRAEKLNLVENQPRQIQLPPEQKLNIFFLHRTPLTLPRISWKPEYRGILNALRKRPHDLVRLKTLQPPHIVNPSSSILHLVCHGGVSAGGDGPVLIDAANWIPLKRTLAATEFVQDVANSKRRPNGLDEPIRLVFINSCSSGYRSNRGAKAFHNFPDLLIKNRHADFVICNLQPVEDALATVFSATFYKHLSAGHGILKSVYLARRELRDRAPRRTDWSFPSLWVREWINFRLTSPTLPLVDNGPGSRAEFIGLREQVERCRAMGQELMDQRAIRQPFKNYCQEQLTECLSEYANLLSEESASQRHARRLSRRFQSLRRRIIRLLSFRISPGDNVSRGLSGGVLAAIVGTVAFWCIVWVLMQPLVLQMGRSSRILDYLVNVSTRASDSGFIPLSKHAPPAGATLRKFLEFEIGDSTVREDFVIIIFACAAVGAGFGCMRLIAGYFIAFNSPIFHTTLAASVGVLVTWGIRIVLRVLSSQGLIGSPRSLSNNGVSSFVLSGILWGTVAWAIVGLQRPVRWARATRSLMAAMFALLLASCFTFFYSKSGNTAASPDDLFRVSIITLLAVFLGYLLSRS